MEGLQLFVVGVISEGMERCPGEEKYSLSQTHTVKDVSLETCRAVEEKVKPFYDWFKAGFEGNEVDAGREWFIAQGGFEGRFWEEPAYINFILQDGESYGFALIDGEVVFVKD
jgi:hypothetical protein